MPIPTPNIDVGSRSGARPFLRAGCTLLLALGFASDAFAQDDGEPRARTGGRISLEAAPELSDGDLQKFRLEALGQIDIDLTSESLFHGALRLRADPAFDFGEPPDEDFPELSDYTAPLLLGEEAELELREAYVRTPLGSGTLTVGKQQVVWGVADGLKVLDVVDPMDLREFILDDFESSRIPLWTVNAQVPVKDWELQLLWLPDPSHHIAPRPGSAYDLRSEFPPIPPGFELRLEDPDRPNNPFTDSDAGFRLATFKGGWDLTFNYLYRYDDVPALTRRISLGRRGLAVVVTPRYERSHVIGGTFSRAVGPATVRAEYGLFLGRPYSTERLRDRDGVVEADEVSYVVGVDWFAFGGTFFSVQLFQSAVLQNPRGLVRDRIRTYGTFALQKRLRNDTLTVELFAIESFNDLEGLIRPRVSYEVRDNFRVFAGLDIFHGKNDGFFGQFHDKDRVTFGFRWDF